MPGSLVKFLNRFDDGRGGKLHWGRAAEDGLPFRGQNPPLYTQDEWEERVVRVGDARNGWFDTSDPEQNRSYLNVLDGIVNGWYEPIHISRHFEGEQRLVYAEWVEYYLQDGSPTPFLPREAGHG